MFLILSTYNAKASYLFMEGSFTANKKWMEFSSKEDMNLQNLLMQLKKSSTGKLLIAKADQKAKEQGQSLMEVIKPGNGSLTDTTLTRRFSAGNPDDIEYESKSIVYINKELNQYDALLDLAHELTHFIFRKNFNPYELNFSLDEFIKNTVEGVGGEVQAFMMECKIQSELFPSQKNGRYNCNKITDEESGKLSYELAVKNFYNVGQYYDSFKSTLDRHGIKDKFPHITEEKANFVSSAYGIPYPVAAFEEYLTVINKVCENDKRRLGYFKEADSGRSPASVQKFQKDYNKKCAHLFD